MSASPSRQIKNKDDAILYEGVPVDGLNSEEDNDEDEYVQVCHYGRVKAMVLVRWFLLSVGLIWMAGIILWLVMYAPCDDGPLSVYVPGVNARRTIKVLRPPRGTENNKPNEETTKSITNVDATELKYLLATKETVFVNFYAPWCRWSQRLLPIWDEFSKSVQQKVVSVDCVDQADLCREHEVMVFPTLRLFRDGEPMTPDYKMDRTVRALQTYLFRRIGDSNNRSEDMWEELGDDGVAEQDEVEVGSDAGSGAAHPGKDNEEAEKPEPYDMAARYTKESVDEEEEKEEGEPEADSGAAYRDDEGEEEEEPEPYDLEARATKESDDEEEEEGDAFSDDKDEEAEAAAENAEPSTNKQSGDWHLPVEYMTRATDYKLLLQSSENIIVAVTTSSTDCSNCAPFRRIWNDFARSLQQSGLLQNLVVAEIDCAKASNCPVGRRMLPFYQWHHKGQQLGDDMPETTSLETLMATTNMMLQMEAHHSSSSS